MNAILPKVAPIEVKYRPVTPELLKILESTERLLDSIGLRRPNGSALPVPELNRRLALWIEKRHMSETNTMSVKRSRGRPKAVAPRDIIWPVRLSQAEKDIIEAKAKQAGKTGGKWIRDTLLTA